MSRYTVWETKGARPRCPPPRPPTLTDGWKKKEDCGSGVGRPWSITSSTISKSACCIGSRLLDKLNRWHLRQLVWRGPLHWADNVGVNTPKYKSRKAGRKFRGKLILVLSTERTERSSVRQRRNIEKKSMCVLLILATRTGWSRLRGKKKWNKGSEFV